MFLFFHWFFLLPDVPWFFLLLFPFCLKNFLSQSIKVGLLAINSFHFLQLRIYLIHSWRVVLSEIEFAVNSSFHLPLEKIWCHFLLDSKVSYEKSTDIEMGFPMDDTVSLFCLQGVFIVFSFQKFTYCCWHRFLCAYLSYWGLLSFLDLYVGSFNTVWKLSAIISSNIISAPLFLLSFWYSSNMNIGFWFLFCFALFCFALFCFVFVP